MRGTLSCRAARPRDRGRATTRSQTSLPIAPERRSSRTARRSASRSSRRSRWKSCDRSSIAVVVLCETRPEAVGAEACRDHASARPCPRAPTPPARARPSRSIAASAARMRAFASSRSSRPSSSSPSTRMTSGRVRPCPTRVARITEKVRNRIRSRPGNAPSASVWSGSASAAASETIPRSPDQPTRKKATATARHRIARPRSDGESARGSQAMNGTHTSRIAIATAADEDPGAHEPRATPGPRPRHEPTGAGGRSGGRRSRSPRRARDPRRRATGAASPAPTVLKWRRSTSPPPATPPPRAPPRRARSSADSQARYGAMSVIRICASGSRVEVIASVTPRRPDRRCPDRDAVGPPPTKKSSRGECARSNPCRPRAPRSRRGRGSAPWRRSRGSLQHASTTRRGTPSRADHRGGGDRVGLGRDDRTERDGGRPREPREELARRERDGGGRRADEADGEQRDRPRVRAEVAERGEVRRRPESTGGRKIRKTRSGSRRGAGRPGTRPSPSPAKHEQHGVRDRQRRRAREERGNERQEPERDEPVGEIEVHRLILPDADALGERRRVARNATLPARGG